MSEDLAMASALVMAAIMSSRRQKQRMEDPEYAAKEEERVKQKAIEQYNAAYLEAQYDHEEFNRNPRSFLRRLSKSKGGQS